MKKEDKIDNLAGIVLNKKIGDRVDTGDILAYIHTNKEETKNFIEDMKSAYEILGDKPEEYKHILNII